MYTPAPPKQTSKQTKQKKQPKKTLHNSKSIFIDNQLQYKTLSSSIPFLCHPK